jgi:predicted AAA+ superfamily ATPase
LNHDLTVHLRFIGETSLQEGNRQSPVVYFKDLGLRNYPLGLFGRIESSSDSGFLFQNLVFQMLIGSAPVGSTRVHFWRTKDKAEVDFVVEQGKNLTPVEVKYKALKDIEIPRPLIHFCEQYRPDKAYIVNLSLRKEKRVGKTDIIAIPYWELLQRLFNP